MSRFTTVASRLFRPGSQAPVVTWAIAAICLVLWVLELIPGVQDVVINTLAYAPFLTPYEPWRMVTSAFLHSWTSFWHILFNMYTLLIFGPLVEMIIGRWRFLTLYLLAAFGGSVAVLFLGGLGTVVVGASGAIFGLLAAVVVLQRGFGSNPTQLIVVIILNLVVGFMATGISWQAHVGGLAVGALIAWILLRTRGPRLRGRQIGLLVAVTGGLILLTIIGVIVRLG